mmetsp:Transcript_29298/g.91741  ORF Transcript_29298/g.91741 Transcript_29298/m.91741 type:complete len:84 (+) Transcript_29298:74-325(+)
MAWDMTLTGRHGPLHSSRREQVLSSVDYVLSTPVAMAPSVHYFTYDMMQLALRSAHAEARAGSSGRRRPSTSPETRAFTLTLP